MFVAIGGHATQRCHRMALTHALSLFIAPNKRPTTRIFINRFGGHTRTVKLNLPCTRRFDTRMARSSARPESSCLRSSSRTRRAEQAVRWTPTPKRNGFGMGVAFLSTMARPIRPNGEWGGPMAGTTRDDLTINLIIQDASTVRGYFPSNTYHRSPVSQPRMPVRKSSIGVLLPRLESHTARTHKLARAVFVEHSTICVFVVVRDAVSKNNRNRFSKTRLFRSRFPN